MPKKTPKNSKNSIGIPHPQGTLSSPGSLCVSQHLCLSPSSPPFARPPVALSVCVEVLSESRNLPMPVSKGILSGLIIRLSSLVERAILLTLSVNSSWCVSRFSHSPNLCVRNQSLTRCAILLLSEGVTVQACPSAQRPQTLCSRYQSVEVVRNRLLSLCDKVCMFLTYCLKDCAQFRHRMLVS